MNVNIDYEQIDLSKPAPIEEPQRQYYFIAKARKLVKELSEKAGRPLTYITQTFGCPIV